LEPELAQQVGREPVAERLDLPVGDALAHVRERGPVAVKADRLVEHRRDGGELVDVELRANPGGAVNKPVAFDHHSIPPRNRYTSGPWIMSGMYWIIGLGGWQGASARGPAGARKGRSATVAAMETERSRPGGGRRAAALAGACALLLLAMLGGCSRPDPEAALRDAFAELQATIERRD